MEFKWNENNLKSYFTFSDCCIFRPVNWWWQPVCWSKLQFWFFCFILMQLMTKNWCKNIWEWEDCWYNFKDVVVILSERDGTLVFHPLPTLPARVRIQAMNEIITKNCRKIERIDGKNGFISHKHKSKKDKAKDTQSGFIRCHNSPIESRFHW